MVLGKQQFVLGGVLAVALVAAILVFRRGDEKPLGETGRTADVERAVREDLKDKTLCGFCMEPDAAKHAVGDVKVKPLGGDVYQTEIACLCRGATNGQTRVRILRREYAFVGGKAVCTMPNLGWQSPEDK